jgi:hypothetical protein
MFIFCSDVAISWSKDFYHRCDDTLIPNSEHVFTLTALTPGATTMKSLSFELIGNKIPTSPTAGVTGSARSILARHTSTVFRNLILDAMNDSKLKKNFDDVFELAGQTTEFTWVV